MRVTFKNSITFKVLKRVNRLSGAVILRSDVEDIADPRQISRSLNRLVKIGRLTKLGYGVYAKLDTSQMTKSTFLKDGVLSTMRAALTKLDIRWEPSLEEQAYQEGRSTQIPVNPDTKIKDRFRRQLRYRDMELKRAS